MSILELVRPELRNRKGYQAALGRFDVIRLHANELPGFSDNTDDDLNRYPPPRPVVLNERLASLLNVDAEQILITRGSNEAIDLLVRAFCRSGQDGIVTCPPTFSMYRICAEVQNATHFEIPLDDSFDVDVDALNATAPANTKLIFLCSPGNPTGRNLCEQKIRQLCKIFAQRALVVIDQAYVEFSTGPVLNELLNDHLNLVVLRTFSKAYGLAGLRCGMVIGSPELITVLDSLLPPYAIPTPSINGVLDALQPARLAITERHLQDIATEKAALQDFMQNHPQVIKLFPTDANFLLIKFKNPTQVYRSLLKHGILVRNFSDTAGLPDCLRITVGNPDENRHLKKVLQEMPA